MNRLMKTSSTNLIQYFLYLFMCSCFASCSSKKKDITITPVPLQKKSDTTKSLIKEDSVIYQDTIIKKDSVQKVVIPPNMRRIEKQDIHTVSFGTIVENDEYVTGKTVKNGTISYYVADLPSKVPNKIINRILKDRLGEKKNPKQDLYRDFLETLELSVPRQPCLINKEENKLFDRVVSEKVNLDDDEEQELIIYLDMVNCFDRGLICLLDKREKGWYVTSTIERHLTFNRHMPVPDFKVDTLTKILYTNQQGLWGGGCQNMNEHHYSFFKLKNNIAKECLMIPNDMWWGTGCNNPYNHSLKTNVLLIKEDTIQIEFIYEFRVDGTQLSYLDPTIKDKKLLKNGKIIIISEKEEVIYVLNKDSEIYEPYFTAKNKLNADKIASFFAEGDIYYKEAFAKDFQEVKKNGTTLQKLFFKRVKNAYKVEE